MRLQDICREIRRRVKMMIAESGGGHAGGSLSMVEILAGLYFEVMKHDPTDENLPGRDRFILSKGHGALSLYATLALAGYFPESMLETYATDEGPLMNHPDARRTPGVELSTGSLGQGFSMAVGVALAGKLKGAEYATFTVLGDGECHEGLVWEAAMAASHYGLSRLVAVVDRNGLGNDGDIDAVMNLEPLAAKWKSFGWKVEEVDGHDVLAVAEVLGRLKSLADGPAVVIARTVKGKGLVESLAGTGKSHYLKGDREHIEESFLE